MLEIVYHGGMSIELVGKNEKISCDNEITQILELENHFVLYTRDRKYDGDRKIFDAIFVYIDIESNIDEILLWISGFKTKYVVPLSMQEHGGLAPILQDFARRVMLDGLGVPKVLKPGQMIVL